VCVCVCVCVCVAMGGEEEELPTYSDVTHVKHNVAELSLLCRMPGSAPTVHLPVSPADTAFQVLERLRAISALDEQPVRLRHNGTVLSGPASISVQGVKDGDFIDVFVKQDEGYQGPQGEAELASSQTTEGEEATEQDEELPTYSSLLATADEARRGPHYSLCTRIFVIVLAILWFSTALIYAVLLPIALIVVGSDKNCRGEPRIPTWMLVMGSTTLAYFALSNQVDRLKKRMQRRGEDPRRIAQRHSGIIELQTFLRIFLAVWVMCGAAWVYGCDHECRARCDGATFDLAFWTITSLFLLVAFLIICGPVIVRILTILMRRRNRESAAAESLSAEEQERLDHIRLAAELEAEAEEFEDASDARDRRSSAADTAGAERARQLLQRIAERAREQQSRQEQQQSGDDASVAISPEVLARLQRLNEEAGDTGTASSSTPSVSSLDSDEARNASVV